MSECGKFQEAETLCRDALILCRQHLGDHPLTATALHVLAFCRDQQRDFTSSGPLWQEALPARQRLLGPEHPDTLMTLMRIFESYYFQDRFQEGIAQGRDCLERMQRVLGKDHPYTIRVQVNLGFLLARDGQHREAIELLRPSIGSYSLARTNPPEPASPLWKMEMLYIRSLEALGRWSEAERMLRARLELIRKSTVPFDDEPQSTLVELGWSLLHQGQHSQAEALLREGVALHRQRDGVTPRPASFQPYALPHALSKLGVCLTTLGRFKEAEQVLLESHTRLRFLPPYYPRELGNLARRLITLYEKWGKPAEAARWRQSHPGLDSFATMFPFLI
jgi:tetratricopeptide (TPR) repeat protein